MSLAVDLRIPETRSSFYDGEPMPWKMDDKPTSSTTPSPPLPRKEIYISVLPSLPSTPRRVPFGHGTKSSILYLHSPTVLPKDIVRLSGDPLIQDSLKDLKVRVAETQNWFHQACEEMKVAQGELAKREVELTMKQADIEKA